MESQPKDFEGRKNKLVEHLVRVMAFKEGTLQTIASFSEGALPLDPYVHLLHNAITLASDDAALQEVLRQKLSLRILNSAAFVAQEANQYKTQEFFTKTAQEINPQITTCVAEIEDIKAAQAQENSWRSRITGAPSPYGSYAKAFREEQYPERGQAKGGHSR